jgi:deoxyribose-phosphate aldolase
MRPHQIHARSQPLTAHRLEHVLLGPATTPAEVDDACAAAVEAGLAAIAVRPGWAAHALAATGGSPVLVLVTIGRPGDAEPAIADGARHLAVLLDAARLLGDGAAQAAELAELARLAHAGGVHLRAVLPLDLADGELAAAARLAIEAGADELQAGSGLGAPAGTGQVCAVRAAVSAATPRHRSVLVVAAGGPGAGRATKSRTQLAELIEAGADRLAVPDPGAVIDGTGGQRAGIAR